MGIASMYIQNCKVGVTQEYCSPQKRQAVAYDWEDTGSGLSKKMHTVQVEVRNIKINTSNGPALVLVG